MQRLHHANIAMTEKKASIINKTTRQAKRFRFAEAVVKPQNKKYFAFPESQISGRSIAIPSRQEGRWPTSQRGTGSGGREGADDERHRSVRQRRVVLTPRCWRQVGG